MIGGVVNARHEAVVRLARVLADFPGLEVERRGGYLIAPRHGREDSERGEAIAARV